MLPGRKHGSQAPKCQSYFKICECQGWAKDQHKLCPYCYEIIVVTKITRHIFQIASKHDYINGEIKDQESFTSCVQFWGNCALNSCVIIICCCRDYTQEVATTVKKMVYLTGQKSVYPLQLHHFWIVLPPFYLSLWKATTFLRLHL